MTEAISSFTPTVIDSEINNLLMFVFTSGVSFFKEFYHLLRSHH